MQSSSGLFKEIKACSVLLCLHIIDGMEGKKEKEEEKKKEEEKEEEENRS